MSFRRAFRANRAIGLGCGRCPAHVAEKAPHDGTTLRKDCCDALERDVPAPALVDVSNQASPLAVPPAPPPMWHPVTAPASGGYLSLARWDTPHAQGPPVFLRIRSMLI
ncbi:hypothetical protein JQX13_23295 [Archangium violaceum]|uniref:hypothetical protein n=1 Tax=Archangium violaceum TaxID=83451 RepID=UPI00193B1AC5|nr:hypothetical protein [Archangium violaceum]QRK14271.1 hypothetical protein JQX13_23295 [Archangium violaceum]